MKHRAYPAYKPSGIEWLGDIPEHWNKKELRRVLKSGSAGIKIGPFGSALKYEMLAESGYKVYGQENVITNNFKAGLRYIDDEKFKELQNYEIREGDILITMMGTAGKCCVVPESIKHGIMDSHLLRVAVRPEEVVPEFLAILIHSASYIKAQIDTLSKGSIMQGLNSSIIKSLFLALPPRHEQECILNFLDRETARIDALIEKKERQVELLQEKRNALISHAVTKGLNPDAKMKDSGVECLEEVPEGWDVLAIKHTLSMPITDGPHETPEFLLEGIPFLSAEAVKDDTLNFSRKRGYISEEDHTRFSKKYVPKRGDVYMVKSGATTGNVARVETDEVFNIWSPLAVLRPNPAISTTDFIFYFMKSKSFFSSVELAWSYGTQQNIGMGVIANLKIALPPINEQREINFLLSKETSQISKIIDKVKISIETLREYRSALITAAVTGKIDVRDIA